MRDPILYAREYVAEILNTEVGAAWRLGFMDGESFFEPEPEQFRLFSSRRRAYKQGYNEGVTAYMKQFFHWARPHIAKQGFKPRTAA